MSHDKSKGALPKMGLQPRPDFKNGEKGNAPRFRGFSHEVEGGEYEDAQKTFSPKPRKSRRIRISKFL
ncbi:MAG: hypothetical protein EBR82_45015 [Caulobacteraceae bacterium]|nr:hypothetical protein [Caulobacteraceae bacterium]